MNQRNISNHAEASNKAKTLFESLKKAHFQYYANLLGTTPRSAKAELKSDVSWQPVKAIKVMNALTDKVGV